MFSSPFGHAAHNTITSCSVVRILGLDAASVAADVGDVDVNLKMVCGRFMDGNSRFVISISDCTMLEYGMGMDKVSADCDKGVTFGMM